MMITHIPFFDDIRTVEVNRGDLIYINYEVVNMILNNIAA